MNITNMIFMELFTEVYYSTKGFASMICEIKHEMYKLLDTVYMYTVKLSTSNRMEKFEIYPKCLT